MRKIIFRGRDNKNKWHYGFYYQAKGIHYIVNNNGVKKIVDGDTVCKKSGKPFKNGSNHQTIVEFGVNEQDPNKRPCAIFSDGSVCNLDMLNHICFIDIKTSALGFPTGLHQKLNLGVKKFSNMI